MGFLPEYLSTYFWMRTEKTREEFIKTYIAVDWTNNQLLAIKLQKKAKDLKQVNLA